jgi:hypothetical protein
VAGDIIFMALVDRKIGQALVRDKFLTDEQLIAAYDRQAEKKISLKEAIVDLKDRKSVV